MTVGYVIHSAVHANFPNAHCVMHSHEDNSVAVSNMKCGFISNLDQNSMIVGKVHQSFLFLFLCYPVT